MSSVAGKFFVSDRADMVVASIELLVPSDAPSLRDIVGDLQRVALGCAFIEHRRDEVRHARLVERIRIAARSQHEVGCNDRQAATLAQDQRETVRELGGCRRRQLQRTRLTCARHLIAPRLVRR